MKKNITINNAVKRFGDNTVIPNLSLEIKDGEFFTLLGPSGCGKTTLLRMIAGFNTIEGGTFYLGDKKINNIPAHKRNIGMVFQNYAIFPHMSTYDNVAYGLENRNVDASIIQKQVLNVLEQVQIKELKDRMPQNMSGGQQQRVALARAIVIQPDVLLMDEPLSNLDAKLRVEMREVIRKIQQEYKITTVYVTHDQEEALAISDRIAIMDKGEIIQVGSPEEIYLHPVNRYVANFIGKSNFLKVKIDKNQLVYCDGSRITVEEELQMPQNTAYHLVRPHEFFIAEEGLKAYVLNRTFLGNTIEFVMRLSDGTEIQVSSSVNDSLSVLQGEEIYLGIATSSLNLFDVETHINQTVGDLSGQK